MIAKYRIGVAAGLVFWYDGGMMPCGSVRSVWVIAAWMSWAAASMLRSSTNCTTMVVVPMLLVDVMLSMPAIVENCFSSGVATVDAIVSALAPGSVRGDRDCRVVDVGQVAHRQPRIGDVCRRRRCEIMTSVVMTGRVMKRRVMRET